jgi:hypothetical protein
MAAGCIIGGGIAAGGITGCIALAAGDMGIGAG